MMIIMIKYLILIIDMFSLLEKKIVEVEVEVGKL